MQATPTPCIPVHASGVKHTYLCFACRRVFLSRHKATFCRVAGEDFDIVLFLSSIFTCACLVSYLFFLKKKRLLH
ncbi:hypothetical protein BR93DRAFT_603960 [Coniochaeta sp. PMI_546]|nr:hypothetical protein BR93DRAFT_603960 [Coniochaeta sp. PMI_546]